MTDLLRDTNRQLDTEQTKADRLRWLQENRAALESYNDHIAGKGVFSEGLRRF